MLELEKFGVVEMTTNEQKEVEGGLLGWLILGLVVGLLWAFGDHLNP